MSGDALFVSVEYKIQEYVEKWQLRNIFCCVMWCIPWLCTGLRDDSFGVSVLFLESA